MDRPFYLSNLSRRRRARCDRRNRLLLERLECRHPLDAGIASLADDAFAVHENSLPTTLNVLANDFFDSEYEGERRISSVSYGSEGGSVSIADAGQRILYAPPADFAGTETFVYVVDGQVSATVRVSIQDPLAPDTYVIPPDGAERPLHVLANDPFWSGYGGPRRITSVSVSSAGGNVQVAPDGRSVLYTPPDEAFGQDSFLYIVDELYPAQVTISVPDAVRPDEYELVQSMPGTFAVLSNDPFWPGYTGERRITHLVTTHLQGTVQIAVDGRSVTYTPPAGFSGWESFGYVVDGTHEEHVSITVHRPVRDDYFTTDQNSSGQAFNVISNDMYYDLHRRTHDVVDRVTAVTQPESGGTAEVSADGQSVVYTPPQGFAGTDSFTYLADGQFEAIVTVEVTRPVRDDYFSTGVYQDTPHATLNVLANDFFGNGYPGPRQITSVGATANGGQVAVQLDGRSLSYTPAPGYVGQDTFTYTVDDELTATVTLSVAPLAQSDHFQLCADPAQIPYSLQLLTNDHFRRGYSGPGVITSVSDPERGGNVILAADQMVRFTPSPSGWDTFQYTVDGQYEASVSVSLSNHLRGDSFVVDQNSAERALDVLTNDFEYYSWDECNSHNYRGPRRISSVSPSEHGGEVTIAAGGRSVHYAPPEDFHGSDSFTYTVDGVMQTTVTVQVIRRVRDDQFRVDSASGSEALPVLVNDLFGADYRSGAQRITSVSSTSAGASVAVAADGRSVQYTPASGFVGTDTFTYTVDGALKAEVRVVVDVSADDDFPQFGSLEAYEQFLIDDALTRYEHLFGQPAWSGCWSCDFFPGGVPLGPAPPETMSDRTHSETNVQVEGVDEGDIIEFDADYAYVLTGTQLVIVDAWPAEELSVASRVDLEGRPIAQFLKEDRLTVIAQVGGGGYFWPSLRPIIDGPFWPYVPPEPPTTIVTVFDVSDRTAPAVVQTTSMEGSYVQSRGIGDFVYVLVRNDQAVAPPPLIITEDDPAGDPTGDPQPIPPGTNGTYETREAYLSRITSKPGELVDAALPNYSSYGPDGELVRSGLLSDPEDIYRPLLPDAANLINVVSFRVTSDEPGLADTSGVYASGAGIVYASLDNFYVFDNDYSAEDGSLTRIMQFDWDAASGSVDFTATAAVPGSMVNQFSADERDGFIRVATTIRNQGSGNFSGRAENTLFVMREDGGVFESVGSLQNLALGESIQSVRFMEDRAFLVTFQQVDPLFALDLSDPANPRALGHLTLPGFSTYMQLISDTRLLTVGRNTPGGFAGPTQVSLFDVSDLTQPRQIDQVTFERFSTSEAEIDHHAFGYFAEHGILAIPISRGYVERVDEDGDGYRETRQWVQENALAILAIDAAVEGPSGEGVEWLAEIKHEGPVRRSGYIDDYIYSIAADSVKAVHVDNPGSVVGEVVVADPTATDPPGGGEPTDALFPALQPDGATASAAERARAHLAGLLGADPSAALVVAVEAPASPSRGGHEVVLRVADRHYLYRVQSTGSVVLFDKDYEFDAPDGEGIWHAIDAETGFFGPDRGLPKLTPTKGVGDGRSGLRR